MLICMCYSSLDVEVLVSWYERLWVGLQVCDGVDRAASASDLGNQ